MLDRAGGGESSGDAQEDHIVELGSFLGQIDLVARGALLENLQVWERIADLDEYGTGRVEASCRRR